MSDWLVKDVENDNSRPAESRSEAESIKSDMEDLGMTCEIIPPNEGENQSVDVVDHSNGSGAVVEHEKESVGDTTQNDANGTESELDSVKAVRETRGEIPEPSNLTSDPLEVISKNADQFTDTIKGKVVINRQGYAVLAERFDISVIAEPVTLPSETDFKYAEFRAIATTDNGQEYSGFGSASLDRGDDKTLLAELAETRAMKRATAWATGVGMTAMSELENEL